MVMSDRSRERDEGKDRHRDKRQGTSERKEQLGKVPP